MKKNKKKRKLLKWIFNSNNLVALALVYPRKPRTLSNILQISLPEKKSSLNQINRLVALDWMLAFTWQHVVSTSGRWNNCSKFIFSPSWSWPQFPHHSCVIFLCQNVHELANVIFKTAGEWGGGRGSRTKYKLQTMCIGSYAATALLIKYEHVKGELYEGMSWQK